MISSFTDTSQPQINLPSTHKKKIPTEHEQIQTTPIPRSDLTTQTTAGIDVQIQVVPKVVAHPKVQVDEDGLLKFLRKIEPELSKRLMSNGSSVVISMPCLFFFLILKNKL